MSEDEAKGPQSPPKMSPLKMLTPKMSPVKTSPPKISPIPDKRHEISEYKRQQSLDGSLDNGGSMHDDDDDDDEDSPMR